MIQKNRSILTFLLLAFSLQSAQAHDFTLKSFSDSVYSWFQEKNPFSGILVAGVVGFAVYYLFSGSKKKTEQKQSTDQTKQESESTTTGKKPTEPVFHENSKNEIVKIDVMPQGSNLQCGYYALKNGLIALDIHRHNQSLANNDSRYTDPQNDNIIFENKKWQDILKDWFNIVTTSRKKDVLKNWLFDKKFKPLLLQQKKSEDKLWGAYRGILSDLANGIANSCVESFETNQNSSIPMEYTNKILINLFNDAIKKDNLKEQLNTERKNYLKVNDFNQLSFSLSANQIDNLCKQQYQNPQENIDGDHIKRLLQQTSNIEELCSHFTISEEIEQLAINENADSGKQKWNNQERYIHIFCIGNMQEQNRQSSGHWFMVAAQKLNGKKTFYTADSLGIDRTKDQRVKKIIQYLEG